ncbi:MAG: hypothetical protein WCJ84_00310, partial [Candidatus Peregrinibacteria bacterium]
RSLLFPLLHFELKLRIYFKIREIIKDLIALASGSAQPHINKEDVNSKEITIPNKQSIISFNTKMRPVFDEIAKLIFKNQNLSKTRDLLIPQLVTGKRQISFSS